MVSSTMNPAPPINPAFPDPAQPTRKSGLAIASLIVSIFGLFLIWCPFLSPVIGLTALLLGHFGLGAIKKTPGLGGRGMALTGTVLGYVTVVAGVAILIFAVMSQKGGSDYRRIESWVDNKIDGDIDGNTPEAAAIALKWRDAFVGLAGGKVEADEVIVWCELGEDRCFFMYQLSDLGGSLAEGTQKDIQWRACHAALADSSLPDGSPIVVVDKGIVFVSSWCMGELDKSNPENPGAPERIGSVTDKEELYPFFTEGEGD